MNAVENQSRRGRKQGIATDRLANTARLGVLERALGVKIKRYRDPGSGAGDMRANKGFVDSETKQGDAGFIIKKGF